MPLQRRHPLAGGEDPVRVGTVEVGIRVDHLGLDPQPELHAEGAHVAGEPVQAAGPHVIVDPPVAQACPVVAAAAEPAVVSTYRSTPMPAARSASAASRPKSWSK